MVSRDSYNEPFEKLENLQKSILDERGFKY